MDVQSLAAFDVVAVHRAVASAQHDVLGRPDHANDLALYLDWKAQRLTVLNVVDFAVSCGHRDGSAFNEKNMCQPRSPQPES